MSQKPAYEGGYDRRNKSPEQSSQAAQRGHGNDPRERPRTENTSQASSLQELLLLIKAANYRDLVIRIKGDSSLLSEANENTLTASAIDALQRNSRQSAEVSITLAVVLRDLRVSKSRDKYLTELVRYNGPGGDIFEKKYQTLLAYCDGQASQRPKSLPASDAPSRHQADLSSRGGAIVATTQAFEEVSIDRDRDSELSSPLRPRHYEYSTKAGKNPVRNTSYGQFPPNSYAPRPTRRDSVHSTSTNQAARHTEAHSDTKNTVFRLDGERAPTLYIDDRDPKRLVEGNDSFDGRVGLRGNFKARTGNEAKNFYRVGRVFGVFIHEEDTEYSEPSDVVSTRPLVSYNNHLKMNIISHYTRYVVVKEGSVFCWGVPISSYGGRGMHKFRNNETEVRAHAIIHTSEKPRTLQAGNKPEPEMSKKSIKVIPAHMDRDECLLSPASRINFSRPRTIDHNLKTVNVGKVAHDCIVFLEAYWDEQMKSSIRRS